MVCLRKQYRKLIWPRLQSLPESLLKELGSHKVFKGGTEMIRQNNELMANAFENSSRQMTAHRKKKIQNVFFHESTQSL